MEEMPIIDENMRIPWSALARWGEDAYDREQVSLAAHTFALEHLRLFLFIGYNIFNADSSPLTIGNLGKLLDPKVDRAFREIGIDPNRTDLGHTRYFLRTLEYHERLMCEMILCRLADNYVRYLTDVNAGSLLTRQRRKVLTHPADDKRRDALLSENTTTPFRSAVGDRPGDL